MNKKTLLIFLAIIIPFIGFTQTYPKLWQTFKSIPAPQFSTNYVYTNYYLKNENDTISINDTIFHHLYKSNDRVFNFTKIKHFGYLYEIGKKVFLKSEFSPSYDTTTKLILDYNLSVGDSFLFDIHNIITWLKVESVDSIMINSIKRKRITFEEMLNFSGKIIWIENIGDVAFGLHFENRYYQVLSLLLDCYSEDSITIYGECRSPISIDKSLGFPLTFYPNPVQDIMAINIPPVKVEVFVSDVLGKRYNFPDLLGPKAELVVSNLPPGLYWLRLKSELGSVSKSFVKQ